MRPLREDAVCPHCPAPETAFRIEDVGMKIEAVGDFISGDSVTVRVSRPSWELPMLRHWHEAHPRKWVRFVTSFLVTRDVDDA